MGRHINSYAMLTSINVFLIDCVIFSCEDSCGLGFGRRVCFEFALVVCIIFSRSPISIAAAAIYMASQASKDRRSASEIGSIAGAAEVTVRQTYKLMLPRAAELFPADFKFAIPVEQLPSS